ncbi:hypothetical protein BJF93_14950 [Xaviernesmea oryzae]|uniref:Uncharacterized protein n=1 Tax=Xaviernesmea oryzae TaxID=464029 RepID=A0A1Q9AXT0_9HYPH|nr:hypothetical protein BJF93_14950 [Xaviernesmea oryzae]
MNIGDETILRSEAQRHFEGIDQIGLPLDGHDGAVHIAGSERKGNVEPAGPMTGEGLEALAAKLAVEGETSLRRHDPRSPAPALAMLILLIFP